MFKQLIFIAATITAATAAVIPSNLLGKRSLCGDGFVELTPGHDVDDDCVSLMNGGPVHHEHQSLRSGTITSTDVRIALSSDEAAKKRTLWDYNWNPPAPSSNRVDDSAVIAIDDTRTLHKERGLWGPSPVPLDTACPAYVTEGQYDYPHYMTYVSPQTPYRSSGVQNAGKFTPNDIATIFSFDVPAARAGAICTLNFFFPRQDQLKKSSYYYQGGGSFFIKHYALGACPNVLTSWINQPTQGQPLPPIHMEPGHVYTLESRPCSEIAGSCIAGMIWTNDTVLGYDQALDGCPIGLYITYTADHYCNGRIGKGC